MHLENDYEDEPVEENWRQMIEDVARPMNAAGLIGNRYAFEPEGCIAFAALLRQMAERIDGQTETITSLLIERTVMTRTRRSKMISAGFFVSFTLGAVGAAIAFFVMTIFG